MQSVTIIIPVYKKLELFSESFKNNINFFGDSKVIIINDDPETKDLQNDTRFSIYKNTTFIQNEKNLGFAKTVNRASRVTKTDLIMLLNTDVFLRDKNWQKALGHFEKNPKLFAISFAQNNGEGNVSGRNQIYFKNGLFHHSTLPIDAESEIRNSRFEELNRIDSPDVERGTCLSRHGRGNLELLSTSWAEGGSSVFRKSIWDLLGGFDENFSPFYWEDVDLSFSAKKRGYEVLFAKEIIVLHKHESTIGSFYKKDNINKIAYEHQIYFTRKHSNNWQKLQFYLYLLKEKIRKIKK